MYEVGEGSVINHCNQFEHLSQRNILVYDLPVFYDFM